MIKRFKNVMINTQLYFNILKYFEHETGIKLDGDFKYLKRPVKNMLTNKGLVEIVENEHPKDISLDVLRDQIRPEITSEVLRSIEGKELEREVDDKTRTKYKELLKIYEEHKDNQLYQASFFKLHQEILHAENEKEAKEVIKFLAEKRHFDVEAIALNEDILTKELNNWNKDNKYYVPLLQFFNNKGNKYISEIEKLEFLKEQKRKAEIKQKRKDKLENIINKTKSAALAAGMFILTPFAIGAKLIYNASKKANDKIKDKIENSDFNKYTSPIAKQFAKQIESYRERNIIGYGEDQFYAL